MENILRIKFQHKNMRDLLIATKDYDLIEQNKRHDIYWGVCTCKKHNLIGKNHLGILLMKIRNSLIQSVDKVSV